MAENFEFQKVSNVKLQMMDTKNYMCVYAQRKVVRNANLITV